MDHYSEQGHTGKHEVLINLWRHSIFWDVSTIRHRRIEMEPSEQINTYLVSLRCVGYESMGMKSGKSLFRSVNELNGNEPNCRRCGANIMTFSSKHGRWLPLIASSGILTTLCPISNTWYTKSSHYDCDTTTPPFCNWYVMSSFWARQLVSAHHIPDTRSCTHSKSMCTKTRTVNRSYTWQRSDEIIIHLEQCARVKWVQSSQA